ncbi:MAG: hypothetical protein F6K54_09065 [Okeania sp. SIO3B5]|uniref:hypothetical protein n=1 Tax=Okeania sp. SIO3B5 TaxID=2607811 RepID=UPI0014017AC0|nr:hypothetical protein [Okeania sp. SIO3B5]NEO53215.1 hypothetical protein [Okeania sp. SIO3B5]
MSTAKIKKKIRHLQKGLLQRRNPRRDVSTGSATPRGSQSDADGEIASRRSPGALTRIKSSRNQSPERSQARQARAKASANPNSPPQVSKSAALKQPASQKPDNTGKQASPGKPKRDFATGRTLFPVESGGKTQYLPIASEATARERQLGLFVANESVQKEAVNKLLDPATVKRASVRDFNTGRTLFATETADGKREYLPKESEATALELSQGKFVPDAQVEVPSVGNEVLNKRPLFEFNGQRNLFATKAADGSTEYLPKKSDANAFELIQGRYVNDGYIGLKAPLGAENAMSNRKPRYDIGKGRTVYGVETKEGKTVYLPRESDASGLERARGLFIPDDAVDRHESKRRRKSRQDDSATVARYRALRADELAGGATGSSGDSTPEPVSQASDGTALWDGFSHPQVSEEKQRQTLAKLRPKYDLGKGRMVYPTETARGKIEYLPLLEDASNSERVRGLYAAFVPPEPLEDFLANAQDQNQIARQSFATESGDLQAYSQEDIDTAFEEAPTLVLRSMQLVSDSAQQTPELQQKFSDVEAERDLTG